MVKLWTFSLPDRKAGSIIGLLRSSAAAASNALLFSRPH